jgi:hypothetical protein
MPNRRKISFVLNFFLQVSVKRLVMFSLLGLILTLFRTQCQFGMPNRGTHLELLCNFRFRRSVALVFFFLLCWPIKVRGLITTYFSDFVNIMLFYGIRVYCIERTFLLYGRSLLSSFVA